jgi:hypothetical protein
MQKNGVLESRYTQAEIAKEVSISQSIISCELTITFVRTKSGSWQLIMLKQIQ